MKKSFWSVYFNEPALIIGILILLVVSLIMLGSLAPSLFPQYYVFIFISILLFIVFSQLDINTIATFHWHLYIFSIIFLLIPLAIGQVNRGVVRWIEIGGFTIQPTEIIRPFIFLFFAKYLSEIEFNRLNIIKSLFLIGLPILLIVIQPSLGVAVLTLIGIIGVVLSQDFNKKYLFYFAGLGGLMMPIAWFFMQDYQKSRIIGILSPSSDPFGGGYNRIQSMIAVGSGQLSGRGLGGGVQTQLAFLPEKHTDFMFASIAEEFGFLGTIFIIITIFFILYRIIRLLEMPKNHVARGYISGVLFAMFTQVFVHIAMNMGIAPITGLPLPLVSAGGSSLVATMIMLGILIQAKKVA